MIWKLFKLHKLHTSLFHEFNLKLKRVFTTAVISSFPLPLSSITPNCYRLLHSLNSRFLTSLLQQRRTISVASENGSWVIAQGPSQVTYFLICSSYVCFCVSISFCSSWTTLCKDSSSSSPEFFFPGPVSEVELARVSLLESQAW